MPEYYSKKRENIIDNINIGVTIEREDYNTSQFLVAKPSTIPI